MAYMVGPSKQKELPDGQDRKQRYERGRLSCVITNMVFAAQHMTGRR